MATKSMTQNKTKELIQKDKKFLWHPFTQMQEWCAEDQLVIERGEGVYLFDTEGRCYIDGVSSLWCNVHGHQKKEIDDAVRDQLEKIAHSTFLGLTHEPGILLAEKLVEIAPKGRGVIQNNVIPAAPTARCRWTKRPTAARSSGAKVGIQLDPRLRGGDKKSEIASPPSGARNDDRSLTRVFYSDSGSEAVEIALKIAYQYWRLQGEKKRKKFVKLGEAYHGDTVGSVSVGGIELFHSIYGPLLFETFKIQTPYCYFCRREHRADRAVPLHQAPDRPFGTGPTARYRSNKRPTGAGPNGTAGSSGRPPLDQAAADRRSTKRHKENCAGKTLEALENILKKHANQICAVVMEPLIQGAAGMLVQPAGYISRVRELTLRYNVLLIFDEVATGFGRTGKMFAAEHENVVPDIMTVAKGLTGGYLPLAATLVTEEIYSAFLGRFEEFKQFFHGHTFTGNPLACRAALASLEIFEKENFFSSFPPRRPRGAVRTNARPALGQTARKRESNDLDSRLRRDDNGGTLQPKIRFLERELERFYEIPPVGDVRQCGMMVGIELVKDRKTRMPFPVEERIGKKVILRARELGAILRPLGDTIILMPPLSIPMDVLQELVRITHQAVKDVTR